MAPFFGFSCKALSKMISCNRLVKSPLYLKHQVSNSNNSNLQRLSFCTRAVQRIPYCPRTVFENWCQVFEKTYPSESEKEYRFRIFQQDYEDTLRFNAKDPPSLMTEGVNQFSDLTEDEYHDIYCNGVDDYSELDDGNVMPSSAGNADDITVLTEKEIEDLYSKYVNDDECFRRYAAELMVGPSQSLTGSEVLDDDDLALTDSELEVEASPHDLISYDGQVVKLNFVHEWKNHFKKGVKSKKLVVVHFGAKWCKPCITIAPLVDEIARNTTHVIFLKVDVDAVKRVADRYKVDYLPTFLFLKEGKEVDRVVGAYEEDLQAKITKHAAASGCSI